MSLVELDLLSDVVQLSPGLLIVGIAVGLPLWLLGWRWHRFWIVLATTTGAGVYGLHHGQMLLAHPLVAAGLLALAAGILALALVRLLAFCGAGFVGVLIAESAAPHWNQPLVAFVLAGLIGLLLFRWSWMALTSLSGTLLAAYCGLALAHHYHALDAMLWTEQTGPLLNWLVGGAAFLGLAFQFLLDRRGRRVVRSEREDSEDWELVPGRKWYRRAG